MHTNDVGDEELVREDGRKGIQQDGEHCDNHVNACLLSVSARGAEVLHKNTDEQALSNQHTYLKEDEVTRCRRTLWTLQHNRGTGGLRRLKILRGLGLSCCLCLFDFWTPPLHTSYRRSG